MAGQKTDIEEGARFDALAELIDWCHDRAERAAESWAEQERFSPLEYYHDGEVAAYSHVITRLKRLLKVTE